MFPHRVAFSSAGLRRRPGNWYFLAKAGVLPCLVGLWFWCSAASTSAVILWSDSGSTLAHNTGPGADILEGAVKRDDTSSDTLYFKFHLTPLSDVTTEDYFAGFELYDADAEHVAIGNALKAWAYSAFLGQAEGTDAGKGGYIDLHSSNPEAAAGANGSTYEFPRNGVERTIVFKVQYVAGGDDLVTVWLSPDLGPGANEVYQAEEFTTRFNADASFDEIHLRHGGGGGGWIFSDMAIATSFSDFVDTSSAKPARTAFSGSLGTGLLNFRSWQKEPGMPHSAIRGLAQTRDGFICLGSDDGLSRFDGVRFTSMNAGLETGPVRALLNDSHGTLWVGTSTNGLFRCENGRFSRVTMSGSEVGRGFITSLSEDSQGTLWVGTETGLISLKRNTSGFRTDSQAFAGKAIEGLCKDTNDTMFAAVSGIGLFRLQNGSWVALSEPSINSLLQDTHCVLIDQKGRTWVGAANEFVLCEEEGQWRRYRMPRHGNSSRVTALAEEPDGTIWAASEGEGLFQFKGGRMTAIDSNSGLTDNQASALLVDNEGKLWVGTQSGLDRLQRREVFVFGQNEGLGYGAVRGLAEVVPGVVWAAKPNDGLYRWKGETFDRLTAAGLSARDHTLGAVLTARDRSCWAACQGGLLHFKDPQAVADESRLFALSNLNVTSLAEDPAGNIWAGSREGQLWKLSSGNWIDISNFSQSASVTAVLPFADGSTWIGTDGNGLYQLKQQNLLHFDKRDGLAAESIRTLHEGPRNTLWIGTTGGGLSRWRDGQFVNFDSRKGLPDNTVSQIVEDDSGRLWLGTTRGIACVTKRDLEAVGAGDASTLYPLIYGKADGMPSEECDTGFFPAGLKTGSGLLWFSTTKGVVVIDPRHLPASTPPPTAVIEQVLVDGKEISGSATDSLRPAGIDSSPILRVPPGRHHFEFQYTGPSFDFPERTHFRYQLEGWDAAWIEAGPRRSAFYNYVPPGKYRFRVMVGNGEGLWDQQGAMVELFVARHVWQAWWFITLGALAILMTVGSGVRFLEKRKLQLRLKRLEQERALERERTRIAQDLHDEMGAKLCRISFLSEHARRGGTEAGELQNQIASISDAARDVLHSLDEIVWAVNPQNDTIEHVASYLGQYAQDYFQLTGIECEVDLPANLPAYSVSSQARHHLFLAVHEAFTNILKHSGATSARVKMSCDETKFTIVIDDNGSGIRALDGKKNGEITSATAGNGLGNMRQRMTDIGGDCRIEPRSGGGTVVRFDFPFTTAKTHSL